ncbi:SDR family NAD(P)-dependent oxidoreductase [Notoacmeibacter sp. MSK16QG-6]|uniref:SDR family NAD(P)-dependent oxidoreductase n=1 Tax=Notoacmeibacter sp. MSK16QG-6 TaxID=2957982 RepID=UPI0020A04FFD|nr:glucose 1-dehydrogenase [Notoacmeibacter sp. MSK16QG-6]MCP1198322.1 glucose 1-dehydrogenase [Notoacmeibacter sp. MSK16QG-6]
MEKGSKLSGKVALITGGSRGIGAAIAKRIASDGATVAIAYRSDKTSAENVIATLAEHGSEAKAFAVDIAKPESCEQLVRDCIETYGQLDIVVNAAGVAEYRPLEKTDADHYRALFDTHVLGTLSLTRAAASAMNNPGRIVHFSSRLMDSPMPGSSVYAASKAAVSVLTLALSQELGPRGITINAVAPGLIETDMTAAAVKERGDMLRANTPLRRIGQAEDISGLVAFLVSDDARWITGRTIRADGGLL